MKRRLEQSVSVALLALAAASLAGLARSWPPEGEASEVATKLWLSLAVVALLQAVRLAPLRRAKRAVAATLVVCAAASAFAHCNFGRFHFPQLAHYWEHFHYELGARYFAELGYDGLYMASIAAERQIRPKRPPQRKVRDLRTNRVRLYEKIESHAGEVRARFTPERWRRFVDDQRHFVQAIRPRDLQSMRRDHGYNPTPAWTIVAQAVQGEGRFTAGKLRQLAMLDACLLTVAFGVVFRTFGLRAGCLCLVIFGLGYAGRFKWLGGAFLRFDWLAAVLLAVCALARERGATAGALLGYATAVRLFPAVLLLGPAVAAVSAWRRGERPQWPWRLAAGFAAALVLAVALGGLAGRGLGAWGEFADRMQLYQKSVARNAVGLEWLVLYGGETVERALADDDGTWWELQREAVNARRADRALWLRGVQGAFLLLLVVALWRAPPAAALALSMVALFGVTESAGYYWSLLALAPLAVRWPGVLALLALNTAMYALHPLESDKLVRYGLLSWGMALLFVGWLVPFAWRTLRGEPARFGPDPEPETSAAAEAPAG